MLLFYIGNKAASLWGVCLLGGRLVGNTKLLLAFTGGFRINDLAKKKKTWLGFLINAPAHLHAT